MTTTTTDPGVLGVTVLRISNFGNPAGAADLETILSTLFSPFCSIAEIPVSRLIVSVIEKTRDFFPEIQKGVRSIPDTRWGKNGNGGTLGEPKETIIPFGIGDEKVSLNATWSLPIIPQMSHVTFQFTALDGYFFVTINCNDNPFARDLLGNAFAELKSEMGIAAETGSYTLSGSKLLVECCRYPEQTEAVVE